MEETRLRGTYRSMPLPEPYVMGATGTIGMQQGTKADQAARDLQEILDALKQQLNLQKEVFQH